MSEQQNPDHGELAATIEQNPETVARLVARLDADEELREVISRGDEALSDEVGSERSDAGVTESADTDPLAEAIGEHNEELREAIDTLVVLQRSGTLDELAELAEVGSLATAALDDEMVRSLANTGAALGEVAQTAADDDTRAGVETLLKSVGRAQADSPEQVGAIGLVRGLRDPAVQSGLGYLLALAGAIGREQRSGDSR